MKIFVWPLLLGLCLNSSWAQESQQEEANLDQEPLHHSIEPLESNPRKFADLAKTTMDLMSPGPETTEQDPKHLQN